MNARPLGPRRDGAETYLLITVAAFAVTVVAVRWYLDLAGYPKVGGGGIHVAHMLWGGLLLIVAALLPLLFVGRRALVLSALAAGVGVGLFIDEIGKFITESNDYFFAPAAPIIYGSVLLLVFAWLVLRRAGGVSAHDALPASVEALQYAVDGHLSTKRRDETVARLQRTRPQLDDEGAALADRLIESLESPAVESLLTSPGWVERGGAKAALERLLPTRLERWLVILGSLWSAFVAVPTAIVLLVLLQIDLPESIPVPDGPVEFPQETIWPLAVLAINVAVGIISAVAVFLLLRGRNSRGVGWALTAMLINLVAGGLLTFYVAQFGALGSTVGNVILLALIVDYRRRIAEAPQPTR